jgi:hypothetical protein
MEDMNTTFYTEIDDLVMAAYRFVKEHKSKLNVVYHYDNSGVQTAIGLASNNHEQLFLILKDNHEASMRSGKCSLTRRVRQAGISVEDFVNTQLIAFL